ncbi:MAG: cytidylate kinase-like family protein [Paludibacteraceae bacterium]|nr:cytidylate kinase-like family protein [Paludibacteraceae bacterium]
MNINQKYIITINRELGSGGRTVGRKLAEKLGVEYFDKAVINALQERYNLSVEQIEHMKGQEQSWWAEFKRKMTFTDSEYDLNRTDIETEDMFRAETEVLRALAKEQSCVIAGRTACYVFREHPNHLSIFIQASMLSRMDRVAREQNMSKEEARMTIDKVDQMRENYVREFTGTSRYDTRNYQLVLSMDELTEDAAVELILNYIRSMAAE